VRDASLDRARVVWWVECLTRSWWNHPPLLAAGNFDGGVVLDSPPPGIGSGVVIARRTWDWASNSASIPARTLRVAIATFRCWSCGPVLQLLQISRHQ
jgi:hypothetical protein